MTLSRWDSTRNTIQGRHYNNRSRSSFQPSTRAIPKGQTQHDLSRRAIAETSAGLAYRRHERRPNSSRDNCGIERDSSECEPTGEQARQGLQNHKASSGDSLQEWHNHFWRRQIRHHIFPDLTNGAGLCLLRRDCG